MDKRTEAYLEEKKRLDQLAARQKVMREELENKIKNKFAGERLGSEQFLEVHLGLGCPDLDVENVKSQDAELKELIKDIVVFRCPRHKITSLPFSRTYM